MHRLSTVPGGWQAGATDGVILIEQTPAPMVLLTAADTDIQILAKAMERLPSDFPAVRVANLLQLQQQLSIDTYAETVIAQAKVIVVRLLGGRAYWAYGLEVLKEIVAETGAALFVLPGDDRPDLELFSHSNQPLAQVNQLWQYFTEGGLANGIQALRFMAYNGLGVGEAPLLAQSIARLGVYRWREEAMAVSTAATSASSMDERRAVVGILFYRAHYLAGNTDGIDALCAALVAQDLQPLPIFVQSLQDPQVQGELIDLLLPEGGAELVVLINTTSFSLAKLAAQTLNLQLWERLNVPVIQAICSGGTVEQWQSQLQGLSPRDIAMNVALPEVDGRIISRAITFKAVQARHTALETDVVSYEPVGDRITFVAQLAAHWARLRQTPPSDRHVALILANYPNRDGRLANGVGLDTPASCVKILAAMGAAGYHIPEYPGDGDALIQCLTEGVTNDPEARELRQVQQTLPLAIYEQYFAMLPEAVQRQVCDRWGDPAQAAGDQGFAIAGLQLGHIFVGIQPSRGYDVDPSLNYHAPDLEPTHAYLAFYFWLRHAFAAQAIVHVGKHGNLEWLPGKSIALSEQCYPEVALGPLPHLYPFIVNDPGEGAQAKRRAQAVILDHLTPPLTRAELYGPLQQLEALIDEYYEAKSLDPTRLQAIEARILALVKTENLDRDLGIEQGADTPALDQWLNTADGYLCELKEAQIRDGLHVFGCCPQGDQLRDLIVALARHPSPEHLGLTRALAEDCQLDFDPLTTDPSTALSAPQQARLVDQLSGLGLSLTTPPRLVGDAIAGLEQVAAAIVARVLAGRSPLADLSGHPVDPELQATRRELDWICDRILPNLLQTHQELTNLLRGLDGRYIPSGAAGAPTRGRPDVLPTGRNFYSVDIRALPTETAWDVGRKAAEVLIERYCQDHGEYPRTLGLSMWGTATMRTGGDDMAEALALIGVQPVWEGASRRMIDFEILPLSVLGRPRVDVTLRISGFFRDAFPNLIDLFDRAVLAVANLNEPPDQNPIAAQIRRETADWQAQGLSTTEAQLRSRFRIFGSKPGAYGAGLQGLIEAQNWQDDADLARAYINWSSYAYTAQSALPTENQPAIGATEHSAPEAFQQRLSQLQIVLHNQDNREHDLLDSDDYYQFQGGLTAAIRSIQGHNPEVYFGDHAIPANPRVRKLREELARVYRSRVVNPKWIAGAMRHGYKGAFEMAATVDYLFAYDATTHCVEDHMYAGVANAYILDPQVQQFIEAKNPWALRDMAERLLEAHQRGLWPGADRQMLDALQAMALQAEGKVEALTSPKSL